MKKLIYLVKKDITIQIKNPIFILLSFLIPVFYIFFFSFIYANNYKNLRIYIDNRLKSEFNSKNKIQINYLNKNIKVNVVYNDTDILIKKINNGEIPLAYVKKNKKTIIYLNSNFQKAQLLYNLLFKYLNKNSINSNIQLKINETADISVLSLLVNLFLIWGVLGMVSSSVSKEIENKTILILKKSNISYSTFLLSKVIFSFLIYFILFLIYYYLLLKYKLVKMNKYIFFIIPLVIINSGFTGCLLSSLTSKREINSILTIFIWLPAIYYNLIMNDLNKSIKFVLHFDPLVFVNDLLIMVFKNQLNLKLIMYNFIILLVLFIVSIYFLNKQMIKNS